MDSIPLDSVGLAKKTQKEEKLKESFLKRRQGKLGNTFEGLIKKNKLDFNVLNKANLYNFEIMNFTYMDNVPVYQIQFSPKSSRGKFKGTLFIDADSYTLIQMNYVNTKPLKDFSLLGFSLQVYRQNIFLKFGKFDGKKYQLQYIEKELNYRIGVNRPIKLLEKNKYVSRRLKQNELKAELDLKIDQANRFTLIIFESKPLSQKEFEDTETQKGFKQDKLNAYDPNYWRDYTIIEPNEMIRSFKIGSE